MDHHTVVNSLRIPRQRRTAHNRSTAQRLRKKTIDCLAKIKRPFLALKGRISETQGLHIKSNDYSRRTPDKNVDVEVSVVDTPHLDGLESEVASVVEVSRVSLDPRRSNLPTELRLRIWRMSWEPRTVEVHQFITDRELDQHRPSTARPFRSTAPLPASLHVCTESRFETLRYYSLAFAPTCGEPEVYFNFDLDSLYIREADMFCGPHLAVAFPPKDLMRLKSLAITDRYIQHLLAGRQGRQVLQPDDRPLSGILLEYRSPFYPYRRPDLWRSLKELDVVIGDDKQQRHDRINSWAPEGVFVCAHCVQAQLEESLDDWPESPNVTMIARTRRGRLLPVNPPPPQIKPIVKREGHVIFMPCCRLRPAELLADLRIVDRPSNQPKWVRVARAFGSQILIVPESAPCRCRLENYLLSEGMCTLATGWTFNRRNGGELGELCKKWLPYLPYFAPHDDGGI